MKSSADSVEGIAATLERLPITAYQRGIFFVIATAYFFDSMESGRDDVPAGTHTDGVQPLGRGSRVLSSMSFVGMFFGASAAGMFADRFGRKVVFQSSMIVCGIGSIACGLRQTLSFWKWRVHFWGSVWEWSSRSPNH